MNWAMLIAACSSIIVLGVALFLHRRREDHGFSHIRIDLIPSERITTFDGWVALELQLVNRSDAKLWIEDAHLVVTDLEAHFQTAPATGQQIRKIGQAAAPDEGISVSLAGSLYEAAGRPQGPYSFLLSGTIHYRIGEDWTRVNIRPHRIEMTALSVVRVRRIRRTSTAVQTHDGQEIASNFPSQVNPPAETAKVRSAGR
jgi:hypothetical protein